MPAIDTSERLPVVRAGIYCSFGGQTALNVGVQLKDEFEGLGVQVLGTPIDTIILTEDRELFAQAMAEIGERCAKSASATDMESAMKAGSYVGMSTRYCLWSPPAL